ncbi:MAG: DUF1552 domain-containing protein [Verrucomicrobiota bacterium]|nr:DUF1552 domain-containing protein [Verrucomicrobiota bacterium]
MVVIGLKLGILPEALFPKEDGSLKASTPYLKILENHLKDITLFSGLSHANQTGRLSHSSELTWLTSAEHPGLDGFRNTISMDQVAAEQIGHQTRYPSLVLSSEGEASQSYNRNGVMIPAESSPSNLFAQLFLKGSRREIARQRKKLEADKSILDGLVDQTKAMMKVANSTDRARLEAYLDSVRQTEKKLVQAGAWLDRPKPRVRISSPNDIRDKGRIEERIRLMFELIPLILETDSSRIINMGIQVDHGVIKMNGVNESHHNLSHHGQDPSKIRKLVKVESAILTQLNRLIARLKRTEVAGDQLLEHTTVLCGSNLGNANNHDYRNLPIIVAGGGFKHGNFVTYNRQARPPLSNLFLSLLNNTGIQTPAFGASTGTLIWS